MIIAPAAVFSLTPSEPRAKACSAVGRSLDQGLRWAKAVKTGAWATAQPPLHSGQWKPLGSALSPSLKAILAFYTKAKLSERLQQPIEL